ncbi:hypothetical protein HU200_038096 [Digitaria exilis]|uniref:Dirigent protein n=1 Tax=Digitaria exilis TaxID=1010633 RepID=A0A835EKQ2_9POAL|nr:hypothetical protein HU200_038096 [Digitaria exilis]
MAEDNKGAYFEILPVELQKQELRMTLFVHQVVRGPEQNQQVVVPRSNPPFGLVVANDWTVFDGLGSGASLVGNAQGMHMLGSMTQGQLVHLLRPRLQEREVRGIHAQAVGELWASGWRVGYCRWNGEFTLAQGSSPSRRCKIVKT